MPFIAPLVMNINAKQMEKEDLQVMEPEKQNRTQ